MKLLEYEMEVDDDKPVFNLQHNLADYNELVGTKYAQPDVNVSLESYVESRPTYTPQPAFSTNFTSHEYVKPGLHNKEHHLILEEKIETKIEEIKNEEKIESDTGFSTHFRLNAVGMVAVVSFIAVTCMVIAFIIANSVGIARAGTRIEGLQAGNVAMTQQLHDQQKLNEIEKNRILENAGVLGDGGAFTQDKVAAREDIQFGTDTYVYTPPVTPPAGAWTPQQNPDTSTNFFDAIARFFNRIFT